MEEKENSYLQQKAQIDSFMQRIQSGCPRFFNIRSV
jgi:hypothetical protein